MHKRPVHRRLLTWSVPLAAAAMLFAGASGATAGTTPPAPIQPNQYFIGVLNGQPEHNVVAVNCDSSRIGHPVAGQTLSVQQVLTTDVLPPSGTLGFTGSKGVAVLAKVGAADPRTHPLVLRQYQTAVEIPTTVVVPCDGSGVIVFEPALKTSTAISATLTVTFSSKF